jgi:hypothetical protein
MGAEMGEDGVFRLLSQLVRLAVWMVHKNQIGYKDALSYNSQ